VYRDADAIRVGQWLIRAILAAGLLCLIAGGRARAADSAPLAPEDVATQLLLAPEGDAGADRAREARDILAVDRNRKIAVISSALIDLGIHASVGASPIKMLRSAGELGRGIFTWTNRTAGEERALLLLAPDALGGELDDTTRQLYERLEGRERRAQVKTLVEDGERALALGQVRRAKVAADRALELDPGSTKADQLLDAIDARTRSDSARGELGLAAAEALPQFAAWDVHTAASLLTDTAGDAPADVKDGDTAAIARATAQYETGERAEALEEFRRIAKTDGPAAGVARELLADRAINPERALEEEASSYTKRRGLGMVGGNDLADNGLGLEPSNVDFSYDGYKRLKTSYKILRETVTPVNLLVETPVRIWRGWRPDGGALREAATRYLALEPHGAHADEARTWLEKLRGDERASAAVTPFRDGAFVLPHAHTKYTRIAPGRVVVSADSLEKEAPELSRDLGLVGAAAFVIGERDLGGESVAIDAPRALELLSRLADGLEAGGLQPRNGTQAEVLEAVRRLDGRIRAGGTLRSAPRLPDVAAGFSDIGTAFVDGTRTHTVGAIAFARDDDKIMAGRELGGDGAFCLKDTPCIDDKLPVDGEVFASTDAEGAAGAGVRAGYRQAKLSVIMGTSGPHATLVLPIARWLGVVNLLPVEARVDVSLEGVSAGPHVDDEAVNEASDSL
jgi:tetratricopeptide (TPR) repeat protein